MNTATVARNPHEAEGFKVSSISILRPWKRCVAVKITETGAAVRDSKLVDSPTLEFTREEWQAFVEGVKNGEFDIK